MKYFPKVKAAIQEKIDEVVIVMQRDGLRAAQAYLSKEVNHDRLTAVVWGMVQEVGLRFARRQWREFMKQKRRIKGFGFNAEWVAWIRKFLYDFIVEKITFDVFRTMKDVLNRTIDMAITEGWGVDRTVLQLAELDIPGWQAARIVRTEITRATNAGTAAASETFPFQQQKEWISAHDNRVRGTKPKDHASHVGLDGQVVDYEGVFIDPRNGDQLRWPGDPGTNDRRTRPESTINCRCTHAVTAKLTEQGDFIPKTTRVYENIL